MQALRVFCEVAELRSFSAAADRLGISQSAVSQRVRQLEQRLQAELLDRSVRPFTLTEKGATMAREGREILRRYDDLERRIASSQESCSGEIKVDAIYSAGIGLLSKLRQRFRERQPDVDVQLEYKRPRARRGSGARRPLRPGHHLLPQACGPTSARECCAPSGCASSALPTISWYRSRPVATPSTPTSSKAGRSSASTPTCQLLAPVRRYLRDHGSRL